MLGQEPIREHVNSDLLRGRVVDHSAAICTHYNLALGEQRRLSRNGGIIYEMSPVIDVIKRRFASCQNGQRHMTCKDAGFLCGNRTWATWCQRCVAGDAGGQRR